MTYYFSLRKQILENTIQYVLECILMHEDATNRKRKKSAKQPHILRWIREQIGLTQGELGKMIGSSQPTIQAIELSRLTLSESFAYRLQELLGLASIGLDAKCLLANDWNKLPDPAEVRKAFQNAWLNPLDSDQTFATEQVMRLNLLRNYLLLRAVADELGFYGRNASGFNTVLRKAIIKVLGTISDKKVRDSVYQRFIDQTGDPLAVLKVVSNDCRELRKTLEDFNGSGQLIKTREQRFKTRADARARLQVAPSPPDSAPQSS